MNWLYYLAEANLYLGVFYLAYCLFLNKETYYLLNRVYLLFSCGVSFILPVLQVGVLKPVENVATNVVAYTIPLQTTQVVAPEAIVPVVVEHTFTLQDGLWYAYLAGAVILLLVLVVKLYHLFKLMRNSHIEQGEYKLIYLDGSDTAFSFFNYLFIGANVPGANTITRHELVHIRQKHSADILFLEILKIINWFNPFIYLLQNSLKTVHEYIADEQTIAGDADAHTYSSFLVDNAYGAGGISITNSFFNYNLLKRRIMMLHQQRSGNWARLKYLVAVPICAGLLCASTLAFSKTYGWVDLAPKHMVQKPKSSPSAQNSKNADESEPPSSLPANFKPAKTYINKKGYKIEEGGYSANDKTYYVAIISDKSGKKLSRANDPTGKKVVIYAGAGNASGEESIYDDYGYKFPNVKVSKFALPPPPPMPIMKKDDGFNALRAYSNTIAYPQQALDHEIQGNVIASFTTDKDHKIKDVKLIKGMGYGCDDEVINKLKSFKGIVKKGTYDNYLVDVAFTLFGRTKNYPEVHVDRQLLNKPNLALDIELIGYGK